MEGLARWVIASNEATKGMHTGFIEGSPKLTPLACTQHYSLSRSESVVDGSDMLVRTYTHVVCTIGIPCHGQNGWLSETTCLW